MNLNYASGKKLPNVIEYFVPGDDEDEAVALPIPISDKKYKFD